MPQQYEGHRRPAPSMATPLRVIEKAWIRACEEHDSLRRAGIATLPATPDLLTEGLDQSLKAGVLTTAHLAVLILAAERGHPPSLNCETAYRLWTEAMEAIAAGLRRGTIQ